MLILAFKLTFLVVNCSLRLQIVSKSVFTLYVHSIEKYRSPCSSRSKIFATNNVDNWQTFRGFEGYSQYVRLVIVKNHGHPHFMLVSQATANRAGTSPFGSTWYRSRASCF